MQRGNRSRPARRKARASRSSTPASRERREDTHREIGRRSKQRGDPATLKLGKPHDRDAGVGRKARRLDETKDEAQREQQADDSSNAAGELADEAEQECRK